MKDQPKHAMKDQLHYEGPTKTLGLRRTNKTWGILKMKWRVFGDTNQIIEGYFITLYQNVKDILRKINQNTNTVVVRYEPNLDRYIEGSSKSWSLVNMILCINSLVYFLLVFKFLSCLEAISDSPEPESKLGQQFGNCHNTTAIC